MTIGLLADRLPSKQPIFLWGLVVLASTTLAFAVGRTLTILVIARGLQGLSSAIVFGVGYAILFDAVGEDSMGWASGWTSLALMGGCTCGPVIGGLLYEHAGYFQVFLPAIGLIIVDVLMRLLYIPSEKPKRDSPMDQVGKGMADEDEQQQLDLSPCLPTECDPLIRIIPPPRDPAPARSFALPVLLRTPRYTTAVLAAHLLCIVPAALDATLPVYLKDVFGQSSAQTATFLLVQSAPLILGLLAGTAADRVGPKLPASLAFTFLAAGLVNLQFVAPGMDVAWRPLLMALLVLVGLGAALGFPPITADVARTVARFEERGQLGPGGGRAQAFGLMNAASAAGSMAGPLYAGFVKERYGWACTTTGLGVMAIGVLVMVVAFTGGSLTCVRRRTGEDLHDD